MNRCFAWYAVTECSYCLQALCLPVRRSPHTAQHEQPSQPHHTLRCCRQHLVWMQAASVRIVQRSLHSKGTQPMLLHGAEQNRQQVPDSGVRHSSKSISIAGEVSLDTAVMCGRALLGLLAPGACVPHVGACSVCTAGAWLQEQQPCSPYVLVRQCLSLADCMFTLGQVLPAAGSDHTSSRHHGSKAGPRPPWSSCLGCRGPSDALCS